MSIEWNGEGLPPVGCECEAFDGDAWFPAVVVGHYDGFAFAWNYDHRITFTVNEIDSHNFRPIRSESERKRLEAVRAICVTGGGNDDDFLGKRIDDGQVIGSLWFDIYDAIAAGKIPHITLK